MMIPLQHVASLFGKEATNDLADLVYTGVTQDSRQVQPGFVYVAIPGSRVDGHDYVAAAFRAGAVCAIVERMCPVEGAQILVDDSMTFLKKWAAKTREQWQSKTVIGLTGSLGKTTHKEMLRLLCETLAPTYATPGNYNNTLGLSLTILNAPDTAQIIILELGISEPGEMVELAAIAQPNIAYVTNIHPCHLEGLGTVESIADEKSMIYRSLADDGIAIVNNHDKHAAALIAASSHCQQHMLYDKQNTLHVDSIRLDQNAKPTFQLRLNQVDYQVALNCTGKHMAYNAYAAAVIAQQVGVSAKTIVSTLQQFTGSQGRMQIHQCQQSKAAVIDDCYNANPVAMQTAIDCLGTMRQPHKILVCGDMAELGESAEIWHQKVGEWASNAGINTLYAYGKFAQAILSTFEGEGKAFDKMNQLISVLSTQLTDKTVVLIKGSRASQLDRCVNALIDPSYQLAKEAT